MSNQSKKVKYLGCWDVDSPNTEVAQRDAIADKKSASIHPESWKEVREDTLVLCRQPQKRIRVHADFCKTEKMECPKGSLERKKVNSPSQRADAIGALPVRLSLQFERFYLKILYHSSKSPVGVLIAQRWGHLCKHFFFQVFKSPDVSLSLNPSKVSNKCTFLCLHFIVRWESLMFASLYKSLFRTKFFLPYRME